MIGLLVMHRPRHADAEVVQPHVHAAIERAQHGAPFERRLDVAHLVEVLPDPRRLQLHRIGYKLVAAGLACRQRLEGCLGRQHAALECVVAALDARQVDEARRAADQRAAGEDELGHRLHAALVDGARTVGQALAALQVLGDLGMGLEALELVERREVRILVLKVNHEADGNQVVAEMVHEGAAVAVGLAERPALRMRHQALLEFGRLDLPQLLEPDAELLRIDAGAQLELGHQLLGERAAHALGDQRVLGQQVHARRVIRLVLAVLADAHVAGADAAHRAVLVVEHLGAGKARVDLHAQRLGLLAEPAAEIAQAHDVVAVVVHQPRHQEIGEAEGAGLGQEQELVVAHLGLDRRALLLPVGQKLVQSDRIDHGARQDVGTDLRALLDQADRHFVIALGRKLLESDRRRQPGRAATNDQHVIFHRLARHHRLALQCL